MIGCKFLMSFMASWPPNSLHIFVPQSELSRVQAEGNRRRRELSNGWLWMHVPIHSLFKKITKKEWMNEKGHEEAIIGYSISRVYDSTNEWVTNAWWKKLEKKHTNENGLIHLYEVKIKHTTTQTANFGNTLFHREEGNLNFLQWMKEWKQYTN